jgi:non-ribosomal peptide synthetase component F
MRTLDGVVVALERGVDAVVALAAVLEVGAVYVPLDPSYPAARRELVLVDVDACVVVTSTEGLAGARRVVEPARVEAEPPFDVSRCPLVRWGLVRFADDDHALTHVEHHVIHDGWSFNVLLAEVFASYAASARTSARAERRRTDMGAC